MTESEIVVKSLIYSVIGSVFLTCIIFFLFWLQQEYYWKKWRDREKEQGSIKGDDT